jgi:4'-phosphopantetheinyl transferase
VIALRRAPQHQQQDRFFEYWTFKESYIKARGMGLSLPLNKFSFSYPQPRAVELTIDPDLGDEPNRWQLWQFRQRAKYLVAVCAARIDARSPTIVVREAVPMVIEKVLATSFTRTSG